MPPQERVHILPRSPPGTLYRAGFFIGSISNFSRSDCLTLSRGQLKCFNSTIPQSSPVVGWRARNRSSEGSE